MGTAWRGLEKSQCRQHQSLGKAKARTRQQKQMFVTVATVLREAQRTSGWRIFTVFNEGD